MYLSMTLLCQSKRVSKSFCYLVFHEPVFRELFGPVLAIVPVDDVDEAIKIVERKWVLSFPCKHSLEPFLSQSQSSCGVRLFGRWEIQEEGVWTDESWRVRRKWDSHSSRRFVLPASLRSRYLTTFFSSRFAVWRYRQQWMWGSIACLH